MTPSHVARPRLSHWPVPGALVDWSPRALLFVVAVRLRVVRVDTYCGQLVQRQLRSDQVAMSGFHRGLRNSRLLQHMPHSGTGSGSESNEPAGATWQRVGAKFQDVLAVAEPLAPTSSQPSGVCRAQFPLTPTCFRLAWISALASTNSLKQLASSHVSCITKPT